MKLKEAKEILAKKKLDAIVLFSKSPNFEYFTPIDMDHGVLIIGKRENIFLVSPLHAVKMPGFKVITYRSFREELEKQLKKHKRVGFDSLNIYLWQKKLLSKYAKTVDVSGELAALRETKTEEEMKRIRRACEITDEVFSLLVKNFKHFKTEKDIGNFIKVEFMKRNAVPAYEPIVASGRHAVTPHHDNAGKIEKGFMVLDFGAKYKGYCSDMTRTLFIGTPGKSDIELYNKMLKVQEELVRIAAVGDSCAKIFELSHELLGKDAKYFIHGLGHGFGVQIHEAPSFSKASKDTLKKGTVVTVEPGYYNWITGKGIRIEDNIYFGEKKEILTKSTKKLIVLKKA